MKTLYIIGNGFDLFFNLKTSTADFTNYLKQQSIYSEISNALDVLNFYGIDWYEYEQSLNNIDLDEIELQKEIYPDYLSEHEYDRDYGISNMELYVESINNAINSALAQMIICANNDAKKRSLFSPKKKLFKKGDIVLSFNYTSTIEYLFINPGNVPILHIHGCYEKGTSLIFGYRNNKNSYVETWISNDMGNSDYYITQQRKIVFAFYSFWQKQLQIDKLISFLNKYNDIDKAIVLGHSMSAVDFEYMELIEKTLCPTSWQISYYTEKDIDRIKKQKYTFQNKINFIRIADVLSEDNLYTE